MNDCKGKWIITVLLTCGIALLAISALPPRSIYAAETADALVSLSTNGPFELIVNGRTVKRANQAKATDIKVSISAGVNDFILKLYEGTAAIRIKAPGIDMTGSGWKMEDSRAPSGDRARWESTAKIADDPVLGPVVGKPKQFVTLHRTVLFKKTRVWPSPSPDFFLPENGTMRLNLIVDGITGRKLKNWTTYIAAPSEIVCLGSGAFYAQQNADQPLFTMTPLGKISVDGEQRDYYRIAADKPIDSSKIDVLKITQLFIRYNVSVRNQRKNLNIVYWSEADDGGVIEGRQVIPVKIIKPLNGRQPRKFIFELCGGYFHVLDNLQMRGEILKMAQLAGFNHILCNARWCSDNAAPRGMKNIQPLSFGPSSIDLTEYLKTHAEARLLQADGSYSPYYMCTSRLLGEGWPHAEASLKTVIEKIKPHVADYDYEYPPFTGPHSCYCPVCLDQFQKFAKLAPRQDLNPKMIREAFSAQWVDFMTWRAASIFSLLHKSIHRLWPGMKFSVYSGYQSPETAKRYGVDWNYVGELQAVDAAGCGYGRPLTAIKATIAALRGIPLVGGVIVTPYDINVADPPKELTPALILRQFLDSTGGMLAYSYMEMGGQSWLAASEVSRFVATHEDVLMTGSRFGLPGSDDAMVQAIRKDSTLLICVMNNKSKAERLSINSPINFTEGYEFYSREKVNSGGPITCALDPGEAKVYVVKVKQ